MEFIIAIVIVVVLAIWTISIYNKLISLRERVDNALAQISTQIESRWDALKSLIDATGKYSKHEADLLREITEARAKIGTNASVRDLEEDSEKLDSVVGRLIAVSENYPDLKASQVYENTMNSIDKYENNVREARMIYNDIVTRYNRYIQVVPSNIVAKIFAFSPREYFQVSHDKQDMPSWE